MDKPRRFRTADADEMASYMNHNVVLLRERAPRNRFVSDEVK